MKTIRTLLVLAVAVLSSISLSAQDYQRVITRDGSNYECQWPKGAQREMLLPSLIAIIVPVLVGLILGPAGVMGLLIGGLGSGFVLAVFMSNSGGAWDNAKKYVEEGHLGGKNSEAHKATVTGETVGDPFKDTSGPSLNILIKLMSMVSIVMAMLTVAIH